MIHIKLNEYDKIQELKLLRDNEHSKLITIVSKDNGRNPLDDIIASLNLFNLLILVTEYHNNDEYSIGYKLGINTAHTLDVIYKCLSSVRFFLISETNKISDVNNIIDNREKELQTAALLVNDIITEISKLLMCEDFIHSIELSSISPKYIILKQHSKVIPNPREIPCVYKYLLQDKKEIYKVYTNFIHFFVGNWEIALIRLGKIKKAFNDLYNICPFVRITMVNTMMVAMEVNELEALPPDILSSIASIQPSNLILSHQQFIIKILNNSTILPITTDALRIYIRQITDILSNPLTNVIHLNIIIESMIKLTLLMRELQANTALPENQKLTLKSMEAFIKDILKQQQMTIANLVAKVQAVEMPNLHLDTSRSKPSITSIRSL